jgi:SAM-dependent methyltransferase
MKIQKQVKRQHYQFNSYMSKERWCSVWHQLDEVIRLQPNNVLEIGPGPGVFSQMSRLFRIAVETFDLDPELQPDHVGSATALPFSDNVYDVVCAFQMLEHLPYEASLQAFKEMARVSRKYVVLSLPDAKPMWRYRFQLPKLGVQDFLIPRPRLSAPIHKFEGEHYWEINKRGYELTKVLKDLGQICTLVKTYRVIENPYHRFFIFTS